ncbi:hypothetical protein VHUM_02733 [Vanrija humicola]|uniref:pH-response regulator protein palC n=1 Tax=Vanrija humicola TaxID=5417 RepID=A0A7D8Z7H2_VANHU|nr:hypothetical protein VHUM_02733 [Vanrija humicola]
MAPYLFPYPTTGPVTLSNVFIDRQLAYTTELAEATVARTRLQIALKAAAGQEPGSSALAVLEAVQVYHPYLRGIIACLDTDDLLVKGELAFPWKSPLTASLTSSSLLSLPSIQAEHFYVVLTYSIALANYAHAILQGLPRFEVEPGSKAVPNITVEDAQKTNAGLTRAVDLLSQASGVADWAALNVSPGLEPARQATGGRLGRSKWPVETGPEAFRAISMVLLADAHVTAIRKLLLPVLAHQLFAPPGPPLPSNHPSPSLLSKLYLYVSELYTSSAALFKVHEATRSSGGGRKLFARKDRELPETDAADSEIIPELKRYLRKEALLSSALAYKWLGVDAGENGKGNKVGEAVAWVKEAQSRLSELEDGKVADKMKGLSLGKGSERKKEVRKARQGRVDRELADIAAWITAYTKMNDTVAFQPVPAASTLVAPPGRPIFAAKVFTPPPAKFAPLERLSDDSLRKVETEAKHEEASYAGKGSYF